MKAKRICLWSGPRNISTALMYSFAQRTDTRVFDEPLYGFYLNQTSADEYHPGANEVMESMECDGNKVVAQMLSDESAPVLFFKHMTHHLLDLDRSFLGEMINIILTRDPVDMLPSYDATIPNPSMEDVGYQAHEDLLKELHKQGINPIILDSKQVLLNPRKTLSLLCERIGIPFEDAMLSWQPGAREEDGVWAKHWYHSVHRSNGFQKYQPKTTPFPDHLKPLLERCKPIYERLMAMSI